MTTSSHDGAQREVHAWDRMAIWDWLFVASVSVPALATVLGGDQPWSSRLVTLGLLAAVAGAYAWLRRLDPQRPEGAWPYVVYFAGALVASAVLLRREPTSFFLFYSLYPQAFIYLGRWRLVGVAALTLMPMIHFGGVRGMLAEPGNAISFLGGMALAFAVGAFIDQISQQSLRRQEALDALERARAELAASERTAGILSERQRLAREIHDTLAQALTAISLRLETADALLDNGQATQAHDLVMQALQLTRASLEDARRSVLDLRAVPLEGRSLAEALTALCNSYRDQNASAPQVTLTLGEARPLPPRLEMGIYRIVQEALNNITRHAQAAHVHISIHSTPAAIRIEIQDDGVGFNIKQLHHDGRFGLIGLNERARLLGGELNIHSAPGAGTTLHLHIPLEQTPSAPPAAPHPGASP